MVLLAVFLLLLILVKTERMILKFVRGIFALIFSVWAVLISVGVLTRALRGARLECELYLVSDYFIHVWSVFVCVSVCVMMVGCE